MNERAELKGILAEGRYEAPLRLALAPVVAYRCCNDGDWTMESVSEEIFLITGFRAADFTCGGLHWAQRVLPEDLDAVRDGLQTAVRAGRPFQAQYRIRHRDGSERWVWEQGKGIYGPTGEAIALEGFMTDITEHKRAEQALVEASQRLEAHLENSPLAVVEFDPGFRITRWSEAAERLFGWTADEVLGLTVPEFRWVHEEDVVGTRQIMADMLAGRRPRNVHVNRNYRRDGTVVSCEWYNSAIYDRAGRLTSILSQVLDISERKRTDEALEQARQSAEQRAADLEAVLQAVPAAVWIAHDPECRSISGNRTACQWLDLPQGGEASLTAAESVRPKHFRVRHEARELSAEELPVQRAARGIEVRDFEEEIVFADGRVRAALGNATPLWDNQGRPRGAVAAFVDITERKRAEDALRRSQAQLRALVDQAPVCVAMFDRRMDYIAASRRWVATYGRGRSELVGLNHYQIHPDLPEDWKRVHREALGGAFLSNDEDLWIQANGSRHWLRWAVHPWTDEGGAIGGVIMSAEDITERKQAEEALRDSQADLNRAQAVGRIGSWRLDLRTNRLTWSAQNHRIFGIPQGTPLTYETFLAAVHPDDRAFVDRNWQAALRGEPYDIEHRVLVDGRVIWVRERASMEFVQDGALVGGFGTTQDISELKAAEEKLRLQLNLTHAITDCAAGAIFVTDGKGRTTFVNAEVERLFGFTSGELMGEVLHDAIHHHYPDGRPYPFADCPNCRIYGHGETVRDHEAVFFRKDGTPVTVMCANSALEVGGEQMGAVLVAHDITGLKRAEAALRESDRRKDEFLATLAHELRNPLAPIRNAVEVLRLKAPPDPALQAAQRMIERQVQHLVRLVDDLLDVGRITQGRLALRRERVDLAVVLEQALEASRPHLECAGHNLSVTLPPGPIYLDADPVRLAQVFVNLVNNACKFTAPGGQIRVSAEREGAQVMVRVADTGIGVPPGDLPRLFEMFAQLGTAHEQGQGGLGIGLALARGLVEMHGGSIEAHSEGAGKGTELVVRLPTLDQGPAVQPSPPGVGEEQRAAVARRVLVVDDQRDVADSLALLLQALGCAVEVARDGLEAVEAAGRFRPELVLLDIGMPRLDGYAACRRIREHPWGKNMTVIALTGWGQEDDRLKTQAAGFDGHLIKPVEPAVLLDLLNSWNPTLRTTPFAGCEPLHGAALLRTSR